MNRLVRMPRLGASGLRLPLACLMLSTALAAPTGQDEWRPGKYMKQATDAVLRQANAEIKRDEELGYDEGISVLGGYMKPKANLSFARPMNKGTEYVILVAGDQDVEDVDLFLTDRNGRNAATSGSEGLVDAEGTVRLVFTPSTTGQYTLRVNLADAPEASFVAVAILSDDGWNIPLGNLDKGIGRILSNSGVVNSKASAKFHDGDNQWALYGGILKPGEAQTVNKITLNKAAYAMLGACDDQSKDIDLQWLDKNERVMKEDTDTDAIPVVIQSVPQGLYGVRVSNSSSAKATMAVWVVLEIDLEDKE